MDNEIKTSDREMKKEMEELKEELEKQKKEMDKLKKEGEMINTAHSVLFKKVKLLTEDVEKMKSSARTMEIENALGEMIEAQPNSSQDQSLAAEKRSGEEVTSPEKKICKNADVEPEEKSQLENLENVESKIEINSEVARFKA